MYFDGEESYVTIYSYTYDENSNLIKIECEEYGDTWDYYYNEDDLCTKDIYTSVYSDTERFVSETIYTYDADKNIIKAEKTSKTIAEGLAIEASASIEEYLGYKIYYNS